jgi:hypothetical protein
MLVDVEENNEQLGVKQKLVAELRRVRQRAIEWQNLYDTEVLTQTESHNLRTRYAARAAFNIFHMLLLYMLLSVANETETTPDSDLRPFVVTEETSLVLHMARFHALACNVRTAVVKGVESDPLAAANTASLLCRMVELVLEASKGDEKLLRIRQTMDGLVQDLAYARIPLGDHIYSRTSSPGS